MKIILYVIIAFLIATEGIFAGHKLFGVDIHRIIELAIFVYLIKNVLYDIYDKNQLISLYFKYTLIFLLLFIFKFSVLTFFYDEIHTDIMRNLARIIFYFIYLYLAYYLIVINSNFLKLILLFYFPLVLIAFLQFHAFPTSDFAWSIKDTYFNANSVQVLIDNADTSWGRSRTAGLYSFAISLAYALVTNMLISLYLYIKERNYIYVFYFFLAGITGVLSMTRSVSISFIVLSIYFILYYGILNGSKVQRFMISLFTIIILFFSINIYNQNSELFTRVTSAKGGSATGRYPLAMTGLYTIIHNPLGVSKKNDQQAKQEMYRVFHHPNILIFPSHNGFIQLGFEYTILGMIVFLFFIYEVKIKVFPYLSKEMKVYFTVALVAYLGNALLHNAFIFYSDFNILILFAIIAYEYKTQKLKEKN